MNKAQIELGQSIGYLLVGIANIDKHISEEEIKTIHLIVNENWTFFDSEYPNEFRDYIISGVNTNPLSPQESLHHFQECMLKYKRLINLKLKETILESCQLVANTTNRLNKSELIYLSQLEKILKG